MKKRKKVIFLLHTLQHYRIPVFNIVSKEFDITIATNDRISKFSKFNPEFKIINIPTTKVGPFIIHNKSIWNLQNEFDVIVSLMNLRCLDILMFVLNPFRKTKIILWGIGVSGSYTKKFDQHNSFDFLKKFIFSKANALIFYTDYAKKRFVNLGFSTSKLFVANNTVKTLNIELHSNRSDFLFVGSLYKGKGIELFLDSYIKLLKSKSTKIGKLVIVGGGELTSYVEDFISKNNLMSNILFYGKIYDERKLAKIFQTSLVCISPKQAGLSLLKSMGYGVCFITSKNATTGGELLNIEHLNTGIVMNDVNELGYYLKDICDNQEKYKLLGQNSLDYYNKNRTIEIMAKGIIKSISYAVK